MTLLNTSLKEILEIWEEAMSAATGKPNYKLDEKYLSQFEGKVKALQLNNLPAWALRQTCNQCIALRSGQKVLDLKNWKHQSVILMRRDKMSDIEILPDGSTVVREGSPTHFGRRLIGPIQNYGDDT